MTDLKGAISAVRSALELMPDDQRDRAAALNQLGRLYEAGYQRTRGMEYLCGAIEFTELAVSTADQDDRERAGYLNSLAFCLYVRWRMLEGKEQGDLDQAIQVAEMAVAAMPTDHAARGENLYNLGSWVIRRGRARKSIEDLSRAIELSDMALKTFSADTNDLVRHACLKNIVSSYRAIFDITRALGDLDLFLEKARDLILLIAPATDPYRAELLHNMGACMQTRFHMTGVIGDLDEAVKLGELDMREVSDRADQAIYADGLSLHLKARFQETGSISDINQAMELARSGLDGLDKEAPTEQLWHRVLRPENRESPSDDIEITRNMENMKNPQYLNRMGNLAQMLLGRGALVGAMDDLDHDRCLGSFKDAWSYRNIRKRIRINCATPVGILLARNQQWDESFQFLRDAVDLLPMISPVSLPHADKEYILTQFSGLSSVAAAVALNAGQVAVDALRLLEMGRGVISSLILDVRAEVWELKAQLPDLAQEFIAVRESLDRPDTGAPLLDMRIEAASWERRTQKRLDNERQFHEICNRIRSERGFEDFLLPPNEEQMVAAAKYGNIAIINVSPFRSDAFLITPGGITALNLPGLEFQRAQEVADMLQSPRELKDHGLASILEWAWDVVAQPCLDTLGFHEPPLEARDLPRIWWILTGPLSNFPIHAAGRHALGSHNTVMDRAMSLYSSSIKAIIHGRQRVQADAEGTSPRTALLVSMQSTPRQPPLPFVEEEIAMLEGLCPSLGLKAMQPARNPKQEVLSALETCNVFHFAGHGKSHASDPSQSSLLLDDWQTDVLSVVNLRDSWLEKNTPFLAYLSACSTGTNKTEKLADEAIHLVSACHLAGFRHVVGTLWAVSDKHCVDVARVLYETLRDEGLTDQAVCKGLHRAVRRLRDMDLKSRETRDAINKVGGDESKCIRRAISLGTGSEVPHHDQDPLGSSVDNRSRITSDRSWYVYWLKTEQQRAVRDSPWRSSKGRDAELVSDDVQEPPPLSPLLWAPYFHFGV